MMARVTMLQPRVVTVDTSIARPPPKTALPFYSSPDWIALRNAERVAAKGICRRPGCGKRGFIVDHIVEIRDGGAPLDARNVELLCSSHHVLKTNAVRADRQAGRLAPKGGGPSNL
ncbi:HNH endonuclease signature motif containing protein [uncultured Reyranella sp.]|uniref:HNH endonuclease signature motif containing protein n=1 Tax=uncultured Reyranella sp. TaxID=735512 RepID=UPI00259D272E|nr:HNH endonuclease signature motif containing protein [uncultured Reyranella sp.]